MSSGDDSKPPPPPGHHWRPNNAAELPGGSGREFEIVATSEDREVDAVDLPCSARGATSPGRSQPCACPPWRQQHVPKRPQHAQRTLRWRACGPRLAEPTITAAGLAAAAPPTPPAPPAPLAARARTIPVGSARDRARDLHRRGLERDRDAWILTHEGGSWRQLLEQPGRRVEACHVADGRGEISSEPR